MSTIEDGTLRDGKRLNHLFLNDIPDDITRSFVIELYHRMRNLEEKVEELERHK